MLTSCDVSSLVIDKLCDQARSRNFAVACFYFDFAAQKEQSPASMLGALLKQVVSGMEEVPEEIAQAYKDHTEVIDGRGPQLVDIVKMLQTTTSRKPTFICLDALDECAAVYRVKLLSSLNKILQRSPDARVFVTGRPHIQAEVEKRLSGRVTTICITPKRHDIISYLHSRLDEDTIPDAMDNSLKADILRKIPEDISEMWVDATAPESYLKLSTNRIISRFLLVSLNVDAILRETTISRRRQKLNAMADGLGLGGVYGETLSRITGQGEEKSRLGMTALMWISHSERPLKVDELCHALGVEIGSPDLDSDNVPSIGTLLDCCQGLIAVDKEASTVRLIHFTLQEYLRAHPQLFSRAHSAMAETCLSYLNSHQVKVLSATPPPDIRGTPFLEYSSLYWGVHAKRELSDRAKQLALKLFDDYNNHISTEILLNAGKPRFFRLDPNGPSLFSGLHCASFFGIVEIVASLVEVEDCDINQTDCTSSAPLVWASLNGHEGVVKILLGRDDISPDKPDWSGRTPLLFAAENGHEEVVEMLLGRNDISPDKPDWSGRTPLLWAAKNGHEGVVKMLLGRDDTDPDKPDIYGRTPLLWAAKNGHEGVVKMLLERDDLSPDKPDRRRRTPLLCAAKNGHEGVVKMLLGRDDVNPDKPDETGQTPLLCAAKNGHEGVVEMLLGRDDTDPDKPDIYGRTPLLWATHRGHAGVIALLQPPASPTTT